MAEKEGFEPSIPFWGIHDFQSCALGQLRDFSIMTANAVSLCIILYLISFVNPYFYIMQEISVDIPGPNRYNVKAEMLV